MYENLYVPNYMSFNNDNIYLGSYQSLRFKLSPDLETKTIRGEYWYGPLCYEMSTMDGEETFPLSQEGIDQMTQWLHTLAAASTPLHHDL
jgi:hypothetical protein